MDFAVTETATSRIPAMQEEKLLANPMLHLSYWLILTFAVSGFILSLSVLYVVGVFMYTI